MKGLCRDKKKLIPPCRDLEMNTPIVTAGG